MNRLVYWIRGVGLLAVALSLALSASAQQIPSAIAPRTRGYELARETSLQATVVSYNPSSTVAPLGPHLIVQTTSGTLDLHLGNARLLEANHFTLSPGDSVRIVGETLAYGAGTQFVARVIQKGSQSLVLRSVRGFPLRPVVKGTGKPTNAPGGVL
jgi:hypothetical protein